MWARRIPLVFVIAALSFCAALPSAIALPTEAPPSITTSAYASANWYVPTKNPKRLVWYTAYTRSTESNGEILEFDAGVAKGRCLKKRNSYSHYYGCVAGELAHSSNPAVFTIDPAMQTARLDLDKRGLAYTVEWDAGTHAPFPSEWTQECNGGVEGQYYVIREATANGTFNDKTLGESDLLDGWNTTSLERGSQVYSCSRQRSRGGTISQSFVLRSQG